MGRSIHEWIESGSVSEAIAKQRGYIELVRCKDCKHHVHAYWLDADEEHPCILCNKHSFTGVRDPNWFCADGEKGKGLPQ